MLRDELIKHFEEEELSSNDALYLLNVLCRIAIRTEPSIKMKVKIYLHSRPTLEKVRREELAGYLCMSARTLSRKLKKEKTSFQAMLTAERKRRCFEYLEQGQVHGSDLADVLGLSDISHFYKLFRQWTGYGFSEARKWQCRTKIMTQVDKETG